MLLQHYRKRLHKTLDLLSQQERVSFILSEVEIIKNLENND
jgi:hypothetical protein